MAVDEGSPDDAASVRAADGRVPGPRGRATRRRLLDATAALIVDTSFRDLTVVDIARTAGTSPATFYQYFADVEAAILLLAEELVADGAALTRAVRGCSWSGRAGYATAHALVEVFLEFWEEHRTVLSIIDLAIAEGDSRFRAIRNDVLQPVTVALAEVVGDLADRHPEFVEPRAQAAVLVSMLAHVAEHQHGLAAWGAGRAAARESMARIIYWSVTARRPPTGAATS
ncbi:MAG TPA: TetR family transcriptional regulator [Nitriliruptorales bacterium]